MDGARCGNVAVLELSSTAVHVWKTDVDCFPRKKCPDDHWQKFRFGSVSRWWEVVRTNQSKVTKTICSEAMKRIGIILVGVVLGGQSNTHSTYGCESYHRQVIQTDPYVWITAGQSIPEF
jgi:hypothetical protein